LTKVPAAAVIGKGVDAGARLADRSITAGADALVIRPLSPARSDSGDEKYCVLVCFVSAARDGPTAVAANAAKG
jgi:hypothetical protein